MNFKDIKKVYFSGIGGIGMSALARMMLNEGKEVLGSDRSESLVTDELEKLGVKVFYKQEIENVTPDINLLVYTIAMPEDSPELVKARELSINCKTYPEMLGLVSVDKYTIAVAGTHGKTTTTAMIAEMMVEAGLDPTVIVGSLLKIPEASPLGAAQGKASGISQGTNFIPGKSNYFVVEACEYRRSFLNLNPNIAIITNIDNDHLDYYKDITDIQSAFAEFASKLPASGFLICDTDDLFLTLAIEAAKKAGAQVIDYKKMPEINDLLVPGKHNIKDAQCALAVAEILKIDLERAQSSLKKFTGTWRRFEFKGETKEGALVYDDYAHHPTEIKASLLGAREFMKKRGLSGKLIVIFQPHLYSRTKLLKNDFAEALMGADQVILLPIYAARESADPEINSDILAEAIRAKGGAVDSVRGPQEALKMALEAGKQGDLLMTVGAGDVSQLAPNLVQ